MRTKKMSIQRVCYPNTNYYIWVNIRSKHSANNFIIGEPKIIEKSNNENLTINARKLPFDLSVDKDEN